MKRTSSLLLCLLLCGCASRSWTEATDDVRPTGAPREVIEDRPLAGEFFELRTDLEADGFHIAENVNTDDAGRVQIDLLPPALQCLHYGHDVKLELYSFEEEKVVYTRTLTAEESRGVIRECSVQAKLGAELRLRRRSADQLDKLIEANGDLELREQLEAIRNKVKLRLEWE
ncbi:MAG: hypothetical protein H6840_00890 [Planctomycetes bacterium]|nr:hypothetical protein [Planctomycetota bacterium]